VGGELHALGGQAVNVRRLELLLAVTTQVTAAEVVGEDEDDVGWARRGCRKGVLEAKRRNQ
jgi:hypothetical protein